MSEIRNDQTKRSIADLRRLLIHQSASSQGLAIGSIAADGTSESATTSYFGIWVLSWSIMKVVSLPPLSMFQARIRIGSPAPSAHETESSSVKSNITRTVKYSITNCSPTSEPTKFSLDLSLHKPRQDVLCLAAFENCHPMKNGCDNAHRQKW